MATGFITATAIQIFYRGEHLMNRLFAFLAGILFGVGLIVSGMTDANKVIAFLDVADGWDPTLAFVMVGGIGAHLALFKFITSKDKPWFEDQFFLPTAQDINMKLVVGAALFRNWVGLKWLLSGARPGLGGLRCQGASRFGVRHAHGHAHQRVGFPRKITPVRPSYFFAKSVIKRMQSAKILAVCPIPIFEPCLSSHAFKGTSMNSMAL